MDMPIPLGKKGIKVNTLLQIMEIFENGYQKTQKAQNRQYVRCRRRNILLGRGGLTPPSLSGEQICNPCPIWQKAQNTQ